LRISEIFEDRDQIKKLIIMGVREPAADGYRVLRVEYIGRGRIINNDSVSEVAADLREILCTSQYDLDEQFSAHILKTNLHVVALVIIATVSE
jgi:hypothetical protein